MSTRKKYRKEVDTGTALPDDGDHYAITVQPPMNADSEYCRIAVNGRTWGRGGRVVESRQEAIEYLQERIDELEAKATDDKYRGSLPRYPEPPKPANTRFRVHPDFEDEISARELWGDATLASFGADTGSKYADRPWYQHRDAYQEWLAPLREAPGAQVLRVYAQDLTEMAYRWAMLDNDTETLHWIRYRPNSDRLKVSSTSWTSATRTVGGIGITYAPPADLRHLVKSKTPFLAGLDEDDVREWIDHHEVEPLDKADANQVGDDDEVPGRSAGGESA